MHLIKRLFAAEGPLSMIVAVLFGVLFVTFSVQAATTISTNIATDGTLLVNNATSTVTNLVMVTSTTTSATSTSLFATRLTTTDATTTSLFATTLRATNATTTTSFGTARLIVTATSSFATTTATFMTVGSSTPQDWKAEVVIDGPATTTLLIGSSGAATVGSCIQMKTVGGGNVALYVNGTTLNVTAGTCK